MKTVLVSIIASFLFNVFTVSSKSQSVNVIPTFATYPNIGLAFAAINSGLHGSGSITVSLSGNINENSPAVLNGGIFQSCLITTSGAYTVSGNFNEALIILNGADNVTIDGVNLLTLTNSNSGSSSGCIRFSNGANSNTVRNLKCIGFGSGGLHGGRIINIAQSLPGSGGNNDNTIESCEIIGGRRGVQTFGTAGVHVNMNTRVINNRIKNFSSLGIFIGSETLNNTVIGNELFFDTPVNNDTAGVRAIGIQGCGENAISANKIYSLTGTNSGGFIGIIAIPALFTSPFSTPQTNIYIYNNMVALNNCISTAPYIYGIICASNPGTVNYNSRTINNSIFIGGNSGMSSADTECLVIAQNGEHGPEEVQTFNNISINGRTGGDISTLHVGQYILPDPRVSLLADNNISFAYDNSERGWDAGYRYTLYRHYGGQELYKDTLCSEDNEQNTVFIPVTFVSDTDLHLENTLVGTNMNAISFEFITQDFDGNSRLINSSNLFTCRGADEIYGGKKSHMIYFKLEQDLPYPHRVNIALRNPFPPYSLVDYAFVDIDEWVSQTTTSCARLYTGPGIISGNYYLEISSKHSVVTQSAMPVNFFSDSGAFDFTSSQSQSYGNNSVYVNGGWAFYNGDVNQDDIVDATDVSLVYNDAFIFASGCNLSTDVNDDGSVDGSDILIADNNAFIFVGAVLLPGTAAAFSDADESSADKLIIKSNYIPSGRISQLSLSPQ